MRLGSIVKHVKQKYFFLSQFFGLKQLSGVAGHVECNLDISFAFRSQLQFERFDLSCGLSVEQRLFRPKISSPKLIVGSPGLLANCVSGEMIGYLSLVLDINKINIQEENLTIAISSVIFFSSHDPAGTMVHGHTQVLFTTRVTQLSFVVTTTENGAYV